MVNVSEMQFLPFFFRAAAERHKGEKQSYNKLWFEHITYTDEKKMEKQNEK